MSQKYFKVKNGVTTPLINFVNTTNANLQVSYLDSNTLSFSGTSGQLFSITDSMTGTIFAVNDISGVPSIEVDDTGIIRLAETFGNVLIGTATNSSSSKLHVNGNLGITGAINVNSSIGTAGQVLTSDGVVSYWATLANTNLVQSNVSALTTSVNTIKANVDSVASNVATTVTSVNTVQSNVSALTTSVNTIKANVDSVASNVTNIVNGTTTLSNPKITGSLSANASIGAPGDVLTSNGTIAYWSAPIGGGATNLSTTANATSYVVLSDTGTDAIISAANATTAGLVTSSTQTIAGSKTFSSPMTVSADTNIDGYTVITDHLSVVRSNTWTNGIGDDGDGAVGIYAQYTTGANSSTSVTGLFSFASLYTGIYNLTGTSGITGIDAYAQGYGSANSSVSKVTGLNTRVEENGNGKIIEGIGVNSEYYGNIDTYYGFKQNKLEFGTANTAYGIHSNLTASPTTFNFYAASNAYNYFGGNVGIGTTNPTEKLTILEGNARIIRTGGAKLQLADQIYEVSVESTPVGIASDMLFKTNVTERMRIDAAGNVGIGVSSPLEKLDVVGNIKLTGAINANGSVGSANQVLTSNGSVAYWSTPTTGTASTNGFEQSFLLMGA